MCGENMKKLENIGHILLKTVPSLIYISNESLFTYSTIHFYHF